MLPCLLILLCAKARTGQLHNDLYNIECKNMQSLTSCIIQQTKQYTVRLKLIFQSIKSLIYISIRMPWKVLINIFPNIPYHIVFCTISKYMIRSISKMCSYNLCFRHKVTTMKIILATSNQIDRMTKIIIIWIWFQIWWYEYHDICSYN